ncbi:MAG TPA: DUF1684 domain-containing protein [Opitutaceae bacterium]|nr:DUF1684 domain-containing protein [Opitutaceae bacterium]
MKIASTPRLTATLLLATLAAPVTLAFSPEATLAARAEKDAWMRDDPQSPFNHAAHKVEFSPLHYFAPDAGWVFQSKLTVYAEQTPVTILDTKGRERKGTVHGFLTFEKNGTKHTLRVYRMETKSGLYHAIWFTDRTTGEATYDVGRYLDFDLSENPDHNYTLDLNAAYNPYCAYSPAYACAIPREEDALDLAITAGEKKWHE